MRNSKKRQGTKDAAEHQLLSALLRILGTTIGGTVGAVAKPDAYDEVALGFAEVSTKISGRSLRPDMAWAAVQLARTIQTEGLFDRLSVGSITGIVRVSKPEHVDLVADTIDLCLYGASRRTSKKSGRALVLACSGKSRTHVPDARRDEVLLAIQQGQAVIGVSASPETFLPSALMRAAEFDVALPSTDAHCVALVIGAVLGMSCSVDLIQFPVDGVEPDDLAIAVRPGRPVQDCLERLARLTAKSRHRVPVGPPLHVVAEDEVLAWGQSCSADLVAFQKGQIPWSECDHRRLLLSGAPGTGKTAFAAALARYADVPLVAASVADWSAAPYLSGTLDAMKKSFQLAAANAPCVFLVDEIDGISNRSHASGEFAEYWIQLVNLMLELMNADMPGVVIIGCTNYPDRIDPAMRRAGRLDRHLETSRPSPKAIARIIEYYLGSEINGDCSKIARAAIGATGAEIESAIRTARGTARRNGGALDESTLIKAISGVAGLQYEGNQQNFAVHEAGHIVVNRLLDLGPVRNAVVHARGGEATFDIAPSFLFDSATCEAMITALLAGRAAEEVLLGHASAGSGLSDVSDLSRATRLAKLMELQFGYGSLGLAYEDVDRVPLRADPELRKSVGERLARSYDTALQLVRQHAQTVRALADALAKSGFLDATTIEAIMEGELVARKAA